MKYIAKVEYVKSSGSITNVSADGLTSVSGSAFGYTSNSPSLSDGTLDSIKLIITKTNSQVVRILFKDSYVTRYSINGVEYSNNKRELIVFDTSDTITIKLLKLSKFSANYEILSIDTNVEVEYSKESILELTRTSQIKDDSSTPNFTPISQIGSLRIKDIDNLILNLSNKHLLRENETKVNMYIVDESNSNRKQIGSYNYAKISYKYKSNYCDLNLSDEISKYNEININPIPLYKDNYKKLYDILVSYTPNDNDFELSNEALERFNSINSFYYSKDITNLFDAWLWFCNATKTTLYINENGKKVFKVWQL